MYNLKAQPSKMKQLLIFIISCLALWSCNTTTETKTKPVAKTKEAEPVYADTPHQSESKIIGPKFFDYDAIDYYTIILGDSEVHPLSSNQYRSKLDSFKMGVIRGYIPNDIKDLSFIDQLEKMGYQKISIAPSKFKSMDSIFVEKTATNHEVYACIHVYRDILIFKKSNKVVGTAKICFHCIGQQIKGPKTNSRNFVQNEDFDRLKTLLKQ